MRHIILKAISFAVLTLGLGSSLNAAAPELSADEPLVYDAKDQCLIARGNALFLHDEFRLEADEIRYNQADKTAVAKGNVRVTRPQMRVVAETLSYNADTRSFSCGKFRAGYPPMLLEGESASGDANEMELVNVNAYMGEPDSATPTISAEKMTLLADRRLLIVGARPGVGGIKTFRIPEISGSLDEAPDFSATGEIGYESDLGAFVRTRSLLPVSNSVSLGANIDLYSSRGVLIGPAMSYEQDSGDNEMSGSIDGGWIYDTGDRGYDYFGRDISRNRWFLMARHKQSIGEKVRVTGYINLLSDPEMLRDFRPEVFEQNQYPDSFVEVSVQLTEDISASAFTRFSAFGNDYVMQNRLPELRVDMAVNPLGFGGIYHTGYASYAFTRTRVIYIDRPNERLHAYYGLLRPVALAPWLNLSPRAGEMISRYKKTYNEDYDYTGPSTHYIGELGLDLTATFNAQWTYKNKLLGIDGLRHIVRPLVKWRRYYMEGDTDENVIDMDFGVPDLQVPSLDLRSEQSNDVLYSYNPHLVRYGLENVLQTREGKHGSRTLTALNLYHDRHFSDETDDTSYVQFFLSPASFLNLSYESGFDAQEHDMHWQRVRLGLSSADQWALDFYLDYKIRLYEDYMTRFRYQLTREWGTVTTLGYDAMEGDIDRASFSLIQQMGEYWTIRYRLAYHKDDMRRDDVGVSVSIATHNF